MPHFIRVADDGTILGRFYSSVPSARPPYEAIQIKDPAQIRLLSDRTKCLYLDGRVVRKPSLSIEVDKDVFTADGNDVVKLSVAGVPEDKASVNVRVGATLVNLPRGEVLDITSTAPGLIYISIEEPLFLATALGIRGE